MTCMTILFVIGVLVLSTAGSTETPNIPKRPDFEKIFKSSLNSAFGQWLREQTSNLDCNSTWNGSSYPYPKDTVSNTTGSFFNNSVCECWSNNTTPPVPEAVLSDFHPRNYDIIIGPCIGGFFAIAITGTIIWIVTSHAKQKKERSKIRFDREKSTGSSVSEIETSTAAAGNGSYEILREDSRCSATFSEFAVVQNDTSGREKSRQGKPTDKYGLLREDSQCSAVFTPDVVPSLAAFRMSTIGESSTDLRTSQYDPRPDVIELKAIIETDSNTRHTASEERVTSLCDEIIVADGIPGNSGTDGLGIASETTGDSDSIVGNDNSGFVNDDEKDSLNTGSAEILMHSSDDDQSDRTGISFTGGEARIEEVGIDLPGATGMISLDDPTHPGLSQKSSL